MHRSKAVRSTKACRSRQQLPGFYFYRMIALQEEPTFGRLAANAGVPCLVLYENTMRRRSTLMSTATRLSRALKIDVDKLADKVHFHE